MRPKTRGRKSLVKLEKLREVERILETDAIFCGRRRMSGIVHGSSWGMRCGLNVLAVQSGGSEYIPQEGLG